MGALENGRLSRLEKQAVRAGAADDAATKHAPGTGFWWRALTRSEQVRELRTALVGPGARSSLGRCTCAHQVHAALDDARAHGHGDFTLCDLYRLWGIADDDAGTGARASWAGLLAVIREACGSDSQPALLPCKVCCAEAWPDDPDARPVQALQIDQWLALLLFAQHLDIATPLPPIADQCRWATGQEQPPAPYATTWREATAGLADFASTSPDYRRIVIKE